MSRNVASATPRGASRRAVRAVLPLATVLLAAAMLAGCEPSRSGGGVYAGVALSTTAINTSEGGPNVEFTVALNTAPTGNVAVDLVVTGDEGSPPGTRERLRQQQGDPHLHHHQLEHAPGGRGRAHERHDDRR